MLWLALYLPQLPLESVAGVDIQHSTSTAAVLVEQVRGRALIHTINTAARRAGVDPGMTLPEAEALVAIGHQQPRPQLADQWESSFPV